MHEMKTATAQYASAQAEIERLEAQVAGLQAQVADLKAKLKQRAEDKSGSFYEINPRPANNGGGWNLRLVREGLEVGGAAFPIQKGTDEIDAYNDAMEMAQNWVEHELDMTQASAAYEVIQRPCGGWALRLFYGSAKIGEVIFPMNADVHCIDAYDKAGCEQARVAGQNWVQEMTHRYHAAKANA
jgi:hypothetical protein